MKVGRRGIFVVFEGVDRSGKSTQCRLLVESLAKAGRKAEVRRFPERSTAIGQLIDQYLKREIELDDRAVHLLFSANRWEAASTVRTTLASGTDVVCDRYAYSGVAFSAAKETILDVDWCKAPDAGLPEPDLVVYLVLENAETAEARGGYGSERYEETDMQKRVAQNFKTLKGPQWQVVDAGRDIQAVHADVEAIVHEAIANLKPDVGSLW